MAAASSVHRCRTSAPTWIGRQLQGGEVGGNMLAGLLPLVPRQTVPCCSLQLASLQALSHAHWWYKTHDRCPAYCGCVITYMVGSACPQLQPHTADLERLCKATSAPPPASQSA